MGSIKSDVAKQTKAIVKDAAKRAAYEPLEVLKSTPSQVTGNIKGEEMITSAQDLVPDKKEATSEEKRKVEAQSKQMLEKLEAEIEQIRREKEIADKERREKFKAQEEVSEEEKPALLEVSSKPSRKIKVGIKGKIDKLKRKTEIRMPPSG